MDNPRPLRFQRYADEIEALIAQGRLAPGQRLPSVRQASAQRGFSASTVAQAYDLLEARGLIQARPRAGYYVQAAASEPQTAPVAQSGAGPVREVIDLVFEVLARTRDPALVPLGSAFPSAGLFPLDALARRLTPANRSQGPQGAQRLTEDLTCGDEALRRWIALRYALGGAGTTLDEIVITNGAMEGLSLALQLLTRPGDLVAVEAPCFYAQLQALERLQLRAVEVATHPRTGVDLAALERLLQEQPVRVCWFMSSFQNPLGALMPDEKKKALVALLARFEVPLIEDDVYAELHHGPRRPAPAKAHDREGRVLHCSSFSKSLAPGWRVGWVAAGRYAAELERLKLMQSLSTAVPTQLALVDYLQSGQYDRHLRRLRQRLATQMALMRRAIVKHFPSGTRVTQPEGGYFLWVELPAGQDALALQAAALAQGISLAPGQLFSADRRFGHCLRINCGHPDDPRCLEALATLGRLAAEMTP